MLVIVGEAVDFGPRVNNIMDITKVLLSYIYRIASNILSERVQRCAVTIYCWFECKSLRS
jgi:hypothetical protein